MWAWNRPSQEGYRAHGWCSRGRGGCDPRAGTIGSMKKLIAVVIVLVIGAVIYKVLTTEIPIDES